ncbi:hypothetical protein EB796_001994 [Bugula neritina]|uniref:SBNO1 n=1 Tax=Bugula neritina TaxID=10212 RepID=A0A7J7KNE9_BUGNE|nr:hypothetical protein EB796_001994 [Bugula neritina]
MNGDGSQGQSQVDLFSQALDLLDEVNKDVEEKVTQVSSEKPANQSTKSIDVVDSAQSQAAVTLPAVSITPRPAATSLLSHTRLPNSGQSLPRVLPITAGLIRSANGKFILTNANGASRGILGQPLANARILQTNITENPSRGMVRNGSAPNLSSTSLLRPTQPLNQPLTSKTVSRIWSTEAVSVKDINTPSVKTPDEEEEAEDDEELGVAETYSDYMPSKVKIGVRHPDSVVETSSLSSVAPPDVWYDLSIPEDIIDGGELSALQLEAIIYSCQRHETILPCGERAGYLIGDGAGVGKGRTVAGVIYENYLCGRKRALWFSVSADLKVDAERDLSDIGASKIPVYALNKFKYSKISSSENGNVKKGVIFSTYSSLIGESQSSGKYRTRMKMLLNWCGADFDGVIVFDECHKAKNLCPTGSSKPTKTGLCVLELQKKLPKARVVYASATGASEPRNMAYMSRLGLWGTGTPFTEFNDFIQAVERRGVGAMELVAMDMKLRGMYIARQLSFQGVSFKIEDIPVPKESIKVYNQAVELWVDARKKFAEAAELIEAERSMKKSMWGQFWSSHQRFFKYLCISSKVQFAIKIAKEALRHRKCVVIGLQSTGEARTLEQLEEMGGELTDFVSTAKGVFQTLIEKHFPAPDTQKTLDIFGLRDKKNSIFDDISLSNILTGNQRKASLKTQLGKTRSGAGSLYKETELSDESPSSSESEFQPSDDESNFSQDEKSSEEEVTSEEDDFNPFNGSDSDDDPWLKKSKNKMGTKRKKTDKPLKAAKKVKSDPQSSSKVKKSSNHKSKQTRNGKEGGDSSSEMSGSEIDELMDSVFNRKSIKSSAHKSQQNDVEVKRELSSNSTLTPEQAKEKASALKKELLAKIEKIGNHLPSNTLDELIDSFGGVDKVAEMTGRKGRVVSDETGAINYELRTAQDVGLEILNLTEKQRFMDGEKLIAIISRGC